MCLSSHFRDVLVEDDVVLTVVAVWVTDEVSETVTDEADEVLL